MTTTGSARRGCAAGFVLVVLAVFGAWFWFDATFGQDPPVRMQTASEDFEPWPTDLEVIDSRVVMGGPNVSIFTAPNIERLYTVVATSDDASDTSASAVAAHLGTLGWSLTANTTDDRSISWYEYMGAGPTGEYAYIGTLTHYLDSGSWAREDLGAAEQLWDAAEDDLQAAVVVQVFAVGSRQPTG